MEINELGCVYFIRLNGLTPVKIGYSTKSSPQDRLDTIRIAAPYGAELLGFVLSENAKALETKLHNELQAVRLHGEWFDITTDKVRSLCEKHMHPTQRDEMSMIYEFYSKSKLNKKEKEEVDIMSLFVFGTYEFFSKLTIKKGVRYDKQSMRDKYLKDGGFEQLSQRKFTSLYRMYYESLGFEVIEGKSHVRWIMILDKQV